MTLSEIRKSFLEFFKKKGHKIVSSDLLVPQNDPTLLFTGAGMNQFKEQFMGKNVTFTRAATSQKCLRTGDLENVGKTPRHHTFFEMLGNFSFGDYFKEEAIQWSWEYMTEVLKISKDKLWVSVYTDDDEAYDIWLKRIGVPEERIVRLGEHDNFWPADAPSKGPNGPCGPCSEIFYDWGLDVGCGEMDCSPACDCGRFVEVWNLVFTQYERKPDGRLDPLPSKNIDTGMGLERIASVIQNVRTNFDIDAFKPIIENIKKELKGKADNLDKSAFNLIADHIRAAVFSICDGVSPSNEKRGYVIRKLIRRAYLKSGMKKPFLYNIVPSVVKVMKDVYPELEEKREHISAIIKDEEDRFNDTLNSAMPVYEEMVSGASKRLEGENVFKLVDTYGLPLDIIIQESESRDIKVDVSKFEQLMEQRKEESRKASNIEADFIFQPDKFTDAPKPEFSNSIPLETSLEFILQGEEEEEIIEEGQIAEIITSPQSGVLYSEGGGQVGDKGRIEKSDASMDIVNTFETDGRKVLEVLVKKGSFKKGDKVVLHLEEEIKKNTALNHTATHLLQAALRQVLGEQVKQSGSYVDDKRLRFDFTHMKKLTSREIRKVEDLVNGWISEAIPVCKEKKKIEEAKAEGALSFFGEKYDDIVRVVSIKGASKELCGGTHVDNTSDIGLVKITHESSVASGIRRIEAVTGDNVEKWLKSSAGEVIKTYNELVNSSPEAEEVVSKIPGIKEALEKAKAIAGGSSEINKEVLCEYEDLIRPVFKKVKEQVEKAAKKREKEKAAGKFNEVQAELEEAVDSKEKIGDVFFVGKIFDGLDMNLLRKASKFIEKRISSGVIVLGSSAEGKACLTCTVTKDLVKKGISAREIVNSVASNIQGGGGGKDTFAQAGGKSPEGLTSALEEAKSLLE